MKRRIRMHLLIFKNGKIMLVLKSVFFQESKNEESPSDYIKKWKLTVQNQNKLT